MWYLTVLFLWRLATPLLICSARASSRSPCALPGRRAQHVRLPSTCPGRWACCRSSRPGLVPRPGHFDGRRRPGCGWSRRRDGRRRSRWPRSSPVTFSKEWLYWRTGYPDLDVSFWVGAAVRLGLLVVAGTLALSALSLLPRSQRWFTSLGSASLVVYLCHGFVVKGAEYAGVGTLSERDPVTAFLAVTAAAVGVSLLLAAAPVSRRLNVLVDPITTLTADTPGVPGAGGTTAPRPLDRLALVHRRPDPAEAQPAPGRSSGPRRRPALRGTDSSARAGLRRQGHRPRGGRDAGRRLPGPRLVHRPRPAGRRAGPARSPTGSYGPPAQVGPRGRRTGG